MFCRRVHHRVESAARAGIDNTGRYIQNARVLHDGEREKEREGEGEKRRVHYIRITSALRGDIVRIAPRVCRAERVCLSPFHRKGKQGGAGRSSPSERP